MKTLISVVVPMRNSEKTIKNSLESVCTQDYDNLEIIIIDNDSSDKSMEIVNFLVKNNKNINIEIYTEKRVGRSYSRNLGISESKGELIAMLDSDCIAPKNWLSRISKPVIENRSKIVMGGEEPEFSNYFSNQIQIANQGIIKLNNNNFISHLDTKNIIFHKSVFDNFMFDENIKNCEDFDLYLRISRKFKILYAPDIKVIHRHKVNFMGWVNTQFDRGYETTKIFNKYRNDKKIMKHPMLESFSIINWVKLPIFLILSIFRHPYRFYFILTTEMSWRIGILYALLKLEN